MKALNVTKTSPKLLQSAWRTALLGYMVHCANTGEKADIKVLYQATRTFFEHDALIASGQLARLVIRIDGGAKHIAPIIYPN